MSKAKRRYSRKGMKDVAHGPETDHEQAKLGLRLQILIFSQRLQRAVDPKPCDKPVGYLGFIFDREREASGVEGKRWGKRGCEATEPDFVFLCCDEGAGAR